MDTSPTLIALALGCAGMTCLSLALERHHEQVFGRRTVPAARRRLARLGGCLLLALALGLCVRTRGWGIGLAAFCALATASILPVAWLLPYAPRLLAGVAAACAALGGAASVARIFL